MGLPANIFFCKWGAMTVRGVDPRPGSFLVQRLFTFALRKRRDGLFDCVFICYKHLIIISNFFFNLAISLLAISRCGGSCLQVGWNLQQGTSLLLM